VLIAINPGVPPLPSDVVASIAADTLLSDKFVLLSGGSSQAPPQRPTPSFRAFRRRRLTN
jgi:ABC-type transporter Mla subunit MlaD